MARAGAGRAGTRLDTGLLLLVGLATLLVVAIVPGLEQPGTAPRTALLVAGVPGVLVFLFLGRRERGARRGAIPGAPALLAAVPLAAGVAGALRLAASAEGPAAFRELLPLAALCGLATAGAAATSAEPERGARVLVAPLAAALLLASLAGLAQAWLGWDGLPTARPPAGPFVNRNVAAQALVPLLALLLPASAVLRSRGGRLLVGAAALAGGAFLLATRSRGGWVAGLAALAVVLAVDRPWRRASGRPGRLLVGTCLAAGILLGAVAPVAGREPLPSVRRAVSLALEGGEGSLAVRSALRANTAALVLAHPLLGVGPGRFRVAYADWHAARRPTPGYGPSRRPVHVHCDLLEWAAELGVPAAAALFALLAGGAAWAARRGWTGGGDAAASLGTGAAAGIAGLLVHSLASFPFHSPASGGLGFLLAGVGWGLAPAPPGLPARAPGWSGPVRRVLAAILVAWCLAGLVTAVQLLAGQRHLAAAMDALAAGDCPRAVREARAVYAWESWNRRDVGRAAGVIFRCDRSAGSLPWIERAAALDPGSLVLALDLGARRLKAGDPDGALASYRRALEIDPGSGRAWLGVAMASLARGDRTTARDACARALAAEDRGAGGAIDAFCRRNGLVQ